MRAETGTDMQPATPTGDEPRLPVTVISGFLGSGKTTLVNHVLSGTHGLRVAVIVNEIGEIGIDGDLIVTTDEDMVELSNGCICCSLNNDLVDTVLRVLDRDPPMDHVLVETTGLADPLPVALTFLRTEFRDRVRLDAILATADAASFSLDLFDSPAARNQILYADIILLNKCDLAGDARADEVEAAIRAMREDARIVRTTRSRIPLSLFMGADLFQPNGHTADLALHSAHDHDDPARVAHDHLPLDGFNSLAFESARPFALTRFQHFLDTYLAANVFRGKGILWLDANDERYVFHLVGGRFSLDHSPWTGERRNRLVLIGRDLDEERLRRELERCLVTPTDG